MDCLRSFHIHSENQFTANFTGAGVKTWTTGSQIYWSFTRSGALSTFNVQGFKNVNVFGIDVVGAVSTFSGAPSGGAIPTDWSFQLLINGFVPIIGGTITNGATNYSFSNAQAKTQLFEITRFNPKFNLASPIESVSSISINALRANGTGGETAGNLNIESIFNIIVYYKYEGE